MNLNLRYFKLIVTMFILAASTFMYAESAVVLDFKDRTDKLNETVIQGALDYFKEKLKKSGKYKVIDTTHFLKNLKRHKNWKKCHDMECQLTVGKESGADTIIVTSIDYFAGMHTVTVYTVSVEGKRKREAGAADFNGTAVGMKYALDVIYAKMLGKKSIVAAKPVEAKDKYVEKYKKKTVQKKKKSEQYKVPSVKKAAREKKESEITFSSKPSDVKVSFPMLGKSCSTPCTIAELHPGDHIIKFEKKNYFLKKEVVKIGEGQKLKKTVSLKKVPADKNSLNRSFVAAVKDGDLAKVKSSLKDGAELKYQTPDGYTPLVLAVMNNRKKVAEFLVKKGAKFSSIESGTLLKIAVDRNNSDLLTLLLKYKADLNFKYEKGRTILFEAITQQNWSFLKRLIKAGADVNAKDDSGKTVMMWAIDEGDAKLVKTLKKNRIKLQYSDAAGMLAEIIADIITVLPESSFAFTSAPAFINLLRKLQFC